MSEAVRVNKLVNAIQNHRTRQPDGKYESVWQRLKRENPQHRFYRNWNHVPLYLVTADRAFHQGIPVDERPIAYMLGYGSFFVHPLYCICGRISLDAAACLEEIPF